MSALQTGGLAFLAAGLITGAVVLQALSADAPIAIRFAARFGSEPFACGDAAPAGARESAPAGEQSFVAQDLRFYVHDVMLLDDAGRATRLRLDADGVAQSDALALLDFEDGSAACAGGTSLVHAEIRGRAPRARYTGLRFTLGVPFAQNHADPARAEPPLNLGRMHWGWQAGYKFLRFEGLRGDGVPLRVHLGSTGCRGAVGRIEGCTFANAPVVELAPFDPERDAVAVDLASLTGDGGGDAPRALRCMSEAADPACRAPFAALGLDPATGRQTGPVRVFRVLAS